MQTPQHATIHVLVVGNPFDGLRIYGPITDAEDIDSNAIGAKEWHLATLTAVPAEWLRDATVTPVVIERPKLTEAHTIAADAITSKAGSSDHDALCAIERSLAELLA